MSVSTILAAASTGVCSTRGRHLISVGMRNISLYLRAEPAMPGEELGNPVPDHSVARMHELQVAVCPGSLSVSTPGVCTAGGWIQALVIACACSPRVAG